MQDNNQLFEQLMQQHYEVGYVHEPEEVILKIKESVIGTLGNFVVFSGLPKAGKSTFINAIIASTFSESGDHFGHRMRNRGQRVALFDTESSKGDFYNNLERIKHIARRQTFPDWFNAFQLRKFDANTIRQMLELYIIRAKPRIVILDGFLDIINNYNDEKESKEIINWLKSITEVYNILLVGVIHLGKKDQHTLGHFGSMLDRYAQSVIEVIRKVDLNYYICKPRYLRSAREWYKPIAVEWTGTDYVETYYEEPPERKR